MTEVDGMQVGRPVAKEPLVAEAKAIPEPSEANEFE
jgi:hypothetical protein